MKRHYNQTDLGRAIKSAHGQRVGGFNRTEGRIKSSEVKQCCGCLYRLGFGLTAISGRFKINKNVARKVLQAARLYVGKERNRISRPRKNGAVCYSGDGPMQGFRQWLSIWAEMMRQQCVAEYANDIAARKRIAVNARTRRNFQRYKEQKTNYFIASRLRIRAYFALKGLRKSAPTLELLGCTIEHLRAHLEAQFTDGMSWDNYGVHGWHIDHKRVCASFDLSDPEQQRQCFHYTNLQPMWAEENWSKNSMHEGARIRRKRQYLPTELVADRQNLPTPIRLSEVSFL